MTPFVLVTGDFVHTGGMDAANFALARYLGRSGAGVHLVAHRATLRTLLDIDKGLDLLAAQAQPERMQKLDYRAYMRSFEAGDRSFYRREGNYTLGERLTAAWQAFRRPRR